MSPKGHLVEISPIVVDSPQELAERAAAWTADRIQTAVAARGACYLALAGGETPRGCYQRLANPPYKDGLPWAKLFVYWSDERQVPLDDPASNYFMARSALLDRVPIPPNQVFPLVGDPMPALARVPTDAHGMPRFDIIHLGMGEDGHTASLFPGHPALKYQTPVVAVLNAPKPPPERLTLSLPALNAARAVLFMVSGSGKREALARVLRRDPALPASLVQPSDGELAFIVDKAAFAG
ncbi:MAG TPA: 6-phosphogluconolactonase [Candidatus Dormibacteraeota bacterium]|jgi:6-phosphogluconolactonase|nr:6-phosphogluconolactonase [Candidatus Dormibacteraeota bacterium]